MQGSNQAILVLILFVVSLAISLYLQQPPVDAAVPDQAGPVDTARQVPVVSEQSIPQFVETDRPAAQQTLSVTLAVNSLDNSDIAVREEAIERLGALGDSNAIAGLGYALSDERFLIRRMAVEALVEIETDEALATLTLALDDLDPDLRKFAVDEIAEIGTESATLLLQSFLADSNKAVSLAAREHLSDR